MIHNLFKSINQSILSGKKTLFSNLFKTHYEIYTEDTQMQPLV